MDDDEVGPPPGLSRWQNHVLRWCLKVGVLWTTVVWTLVSIIFSEIATLLVFAMLRGDPFGGLPSNYLLSFVIPALVTPPLSLWSIRTMRQLQEADDRYRRLLVRYRALAEQDQLTGMLNRRGLYAREVDCCGRVPWSR